MGRRGVIGLVLSLVMSFCVQSFTGVAGAAPGVDAPVVWMGGASTSSGPIDMLTTVGTGDALNWGAAGTRHRCNVSVSHLSAGPQSYGFQKVAPYLGMKGTFQCFGHVKPSNPLKGFLLGLPTFGPATLDLYGLDCDPSSPTRVDATGSECNAGSTNATRSITMSSQYCERTQYVATSTASGQPGYATYGPGELYAAVFECNWSVPGYSGIYNYGTTYSCTQFDAGEVTTYPSYGPHGHPTGASNCNPDLDLVDLESEMRVRARCSTTAHACNQTSEENYVDVEEFAVLQNGVTQPPFGFPDLYPLHMTPPESVLEPALSDPTEFVPRLSCGRTLRNLGEGTWFVDVEGIVRNSPGPDSSDSEGYWTVSWDNAEVYEGAKATIPLPLNATSTEYLYATFHVTRTSTVGFGWSSQEASNGEWVETEMTTAGGVVVPGLSWLITLLSDDELAADVVGNHSYVGYRWEDGYQPPVVENQVVPVDEVDATCVIKVSPVTETKDPPVVVVVPSNPADSGGPDGPEPAPPASEDPVDSCGGGTWWNPVTWAKSMFCGIMDLAELLADLIGAILGLAAEIVGGITGWLVDALTGMTFPGIPELSGEWSDKFPLSIMTEAVDSLTVLQTSMSSGVANQCGPTLDPNLDARITLPGEGTASKLDALKVSLPVPVAGCGQTEEVRNFADLGGMRTPIRGFLELSLMVSFLVRVVHSIGPTKSSITPDQS